LNCKEQYVHNILNGNSWSSYTGIERQESEKNFLSLEEVNNIVNLLQDGLEYKEISKTLNIDKNIVWNVIHGKTYAQLTNIEYEKISKAEKITTTQV